MEYVTQEVDFCLSLEQIYIHGLNEELGRHRGKEGVRQNVPFVGMSVRM